MSISNSKFSLVKVDTIDFCNTFGFNIKIDEIKKNILHILEIKYKIKIITRHFERFNQNMILKDCRIYIKSNGNPYYLLLTKLNGVNTCIFIDKKIKKGYLFPRMIIVHISLDESLFESDIILDGEMIKIDEEEWIFSLHDVIVWKSERLYTDSDHRENIINDIVNKKYKKNSISTFKIVKKDFFDIEEEDYLKTKYIPNLNYTCRGIYYRYKKYRYPDILYNFDEILIVNDKVIKPVIHTIIQSDNKIYKTFTVKKTEFPDVYELYDNLEYTDIACIPTLKMSKYMYKIFKDSNIENKINICFEYSENFNKWIPMLPT